ncbi:sigma-54-dependent Fis family transcriptional regulator [Thalassobacillus devorans]|uniref:Sigma-54-dependent Fis family transcriptional regulator n=1 Tax=Thalassobacillus devorans TaxID=279813 RepID=A0ABQ1P2Y3_9BACI|nr:sigma-54-dependent Fis family transcriptional regulator [Thalassobacillus devorans]NIK28045.1 transcriptional regulator of acetoin/glycerol metabolism [Thalassobacillus devorans]GGC89306.1 sigma-54-dependent Fis family transcriptional regulator [Thalassobacillus devorans]
MVKDSFFLQGSYSPSKTTERERALQWSWTNFFKKGIEGENIRSLILASWKRSEDYLIDPFETKAPVIVDEYDLEKRKEANKEVLTFIRPFMDDLYEIVKGTNSIIAFSDKDGVVLELHGDKDIKLNASSTNFMVGVNMNEKVMGTNSIGTSLALGHPVQVVGAEHYCKAWHTSHCSTAPINDPQTNEIVGTLTLVGYLKSAHPHSLALVKTASETLVQLLEQQGLKHEQYMINNYFSAAIESVSDGVIVLNRNGELIRHNQIASHLLKLPSSVEKKKLKISSISHLNPLQKNFQKAIQGEDVIIQQQLDLPQEGRVNVLMTSRKIMVAGNHIGCIIIFKKIAENHTKSLRAKHTFSNLKGRDESITQAIKLAKKVALTDKSVMIIGESGTGKELFAQAIHNESLRRTESFLAINCSAIPKELITSELFGYAEGAFTNALKGGKKGKFEAADGGTLFLDEIGDMPLELQAHLLRVLEEKEITPVGANYSKPIDVRIIAATNKDLYELVKENKFRLDLFYRLNVISLEIPPLRKRKRDISYLAENFISTKRISEEVKQCFQFYTWPGNLRELKNVIEQMELFSESEELKTEDLPSYLQEELGNQDNNDTKLYQTFAEQTKKESLIIALKENKNIAAAAKKLGVSTSTVYRWAQMYGLEIKKIIKESY